MLALLDRSNNEDSVIPDWRSPSLWAIEKDTGLSRRSVTGLIRHLEQHRWLQRTGQKRGQLAGTKGPGRGRSATRWELIPGDIPEECSCPKPDRAASNRSEIQIGQQVPPSDRANEEVVSAGQIADCTKGGREGGSREAGAAHGTEDPWAWPADSIGAEVNKVNDER